MAVFIPSFGNRYAAPGLNAPSTGSIVAGAAAQGLGQIANGLASSQQQKQQLEAMAGNFDATDPEIAALLRSQASSVPLISFSGGSGGRGRSGGGGVGGGIGGEVFTFALKQADAKRRQSERLAIENLSHQNTVSRMGISFQNAVGATNARRDAEIAVARERDRLDETFTDPAARERADSVMQLEINKAKLAETEASTRVFEAKTDAFRAEQAAQELRDEGSQFPFHMDAQGNMVADPTLLQQNEDGRKRSGAGARQDIRGITIKDGKKVRRETTADERNRLYMEATATEQKRMRTAAASHLRRKTPAMQIPAPTQSSTPEEVQNFKDQIALQEQAGHQWLMNVPADDVEAKQTRDLNSALGDGRITAAMEAMKKRGKQNREDKK